MDWADEKAKELLPCMCSNLSQTIAEAHSALCLARKSSAVAQALRDAYQKGRDEANAARETAEALIRKWHESFFQYAKGLYNRDGLARAETYKICADELDQALGRR